MTRQTLLENLKNIILTDKYAGSTQTLKAIRSYYRLQYDKPSVPIEHLAWLVKANGIPADYRQQLSHDITTDHLLIPQSALGKWLNN